MYKIKYTHPFTKKKVTTKVETFKEAVSMYHIMLGNHCGGVTIIHPKETIKN